MRSLSEISKEELIERLTFLENVLFGICGRPELSLPTISDKIENACENYQKRFSNSAEKDE
tara:strand:- start:393 stop:575 length:183 start_codon:yes stop_codon:yes gene_type:complete